MNTKNILPRFTVIILLVIGLASCEEDFSSIGADVIGGDGSEIELDETAMLKAYSRAFLPIQTNSLPAYQLGVYNSPVYGQTTVNLLSQITLSNTNPSFGDNPVLDSVYLYIPFFSTATLNQSGVTYTTDSIFGNDPIDITLYESNYLLRRFDPSTGFEEEQKYYSDQGEIFEDFIGTNMLSLGAEIAKIENFVPSNSGFVFNEGDEDEENLAPGLRVKLPSNFFKQKIIDQEGDPVLINNNNFTDFFRGIYFKVEAEANEENWFLFNIEDANIKLHYSFDDANEEGERDNETFDLFFGGVNVNTFTNNYPMDIQNAISNPDLNSGEENLYVKGGSGIVSVIELFGPDSDNNGVADQLEDLRQREWLINEANLIFYVDQDKIVPGQREPERLIIYDTKNKRVLVDYGRDLSASASEPVDAVTIHLGRLERGSDEAGDFYKIRITHHLNNVINNDSTNVPLGLIVSQNVLTPGFQDLQNPQSPGIFGAPSSSVLSPEGTVLYGNNTQNEEKKLKLQIFYTEPN